MAQPENVFIGSVHKHLPAALYKMKNHNTFNGGIADVWYSGPKADLWIEYKFIAIPKRDDTLIDLIHGTAKKDSDISTLQQSWLKGRHAEGRSVGVLIGSKEGGVWMPGVSWDTVLSTKVFRSSLLSRPQVAQLICALTV
jgi:hypothetical protein